MSIWTKKDVADHLRVSEVTINRWMKDKGLPFSKIGGSVRFVDKAINEWIEQKQKGNEIERNINRAN